MKKLSLIISSLFGSIALVACNSGGGSSQSGGDGLSLTVSPPECTYYYSGLTPATSMTYQLNNLVPGHQYGINMYFPNDVEESVPHTREFFTATGSSFTGQDLCQPVSFETTGSYQVKVIAFDITASQQSGSLVQSNTVMITETMVSPY